MNEEESVDRDDSISENESGIISPRSGASDESDTPAELQLYLYNPRHSCTEISPNILSYLNSNKNVSLKHYKSMLSRVSTENKSEKDLKYLKEFDASDALIPHGEVSKRLYNEMVSGRQFDAYARPLYLSQEKATEIRDKHLALLSGKPYIPPRLSKNDENIRQNAPKVFDHEIVFKPQPITTSVWKVGKKEVYKPPIGFARDEGEILNSEGREKYYSYNGDWKSGYMDGKGYYLFKDGKPYEGFFKQNRFCGPGISEYPVGGKYEGEWNGGYFDGKGTLTCCTGGKYEGGWKAGKRNGFGKLELPGGLVYEGEWANGKPHGRGIMKSMLTKYTFEGNFENGGIHGHGTVTTPEGERIVRYWPATKDGLTLTGLVRMLVQEKLDFYKLDCENRMIMQANRRRMRLDDYVTEVRTNLHEGREKEKRDRLNDKIAEMKAQKDRLREAKIRALAGEETEEDKIQKLKEDNDDDDELSDDNN